MVETVLSELGRFGKLDSTESQICIAVSGDVLGGDLGCELARLERLLADLGLSLEQGLRKLELLLRILSLRHCVVVEEVDNGRLRLFLRCHMRTLFRRHLHLFGDKAPAVAKGLWRGREVSTVAPLIFIVAMLLLVMEAQEVRWTIAFQVFPICDDRGGFQVGWHDLAHILLIVKDG